MTFAIAGGAVMGIAHLNESLLERITRKLRAGWKRLGEILNQPGVPRHDHYFLLMEQFLFSKETGSSTSYMRKYFRIQNRECLMRIHGLPE